jgi:RNA polymerase sigma-70 factor (ECF subfamily)
MEAQITRASKGDREALAKIVREHYASVYKFCARRVGQELGQDAAQETFIVAQRALSRYDGSSTLLTFLLGIAHNQCRNLARKNRMEISFDEVWPNRSTEDVERQTIDRHELNRALKSLTVEHREAVVMHEIEGLTYDEIGAVLKVPAGTVKSRLHHAFLHLRHRLLPCEEVSA